ncbi:MULTISPECIES: hypothetical protein [Archaeoglobus]|uniref:Uncharacterized protein n=1 Tax=Archaeoglobus fulgidus TaxID=2234 RepID=A0A117KUG8_ARCFL|nr:MULTISPECIES: hypothetical protein [Archaeoglobus]KUJ93035.1 MAG: hypothetical protein XD40_1762 [Archaeoglobus fulgidus]KUK06579.1 MAG: Uncharacterized protein XD48_1179 [Archaeoglobus fulgidus]MDI3497488.1 hypothetical protein [Archaeoglobus sp.]
MPRLDFKFFKILILSFLNSIVFMNILIYIIFPRLSFYEFGAFLAVISLTGLIFLSINVRNKRSAIPFAVSLLVYVFLILAYRAFLNIFPTYDSFALIEYTLLSVLMVSALIFLRNNIEVGKMAVTRFFVFILLYSALTLIPSAYDVLFTEHHLIRESLLLPFGLFQLIATIFGLFYMTLVVINYECF